MPKPEPTKPSAPPRPANDNAGKVIVSVRPPPPPPGMGKLIDKLI